MAGAVTNTLEGKVLDGRYRIDGAVGEGGFATVYAGLHLSLGSPIAIKVLKVPEGSTLEQRTTMLATFVEEARTIMRLRHEGIVRTLDQGIIPSPSGDLPTPYLVMEWCGEKTLKTVLQGSGGKGMSTSEAFALLEPVVAALSHAHSIGIAHRDLKPSNIMMLPRPDGAGFAPRVIDFGIAKLFDLAVRAGSGDTTTRSNASPYTPAYAAPEQIAGARTGPWTDVHALGLIFTELVAGEAPLGTSSMATLAAIDPSRPTPATFGVDAGPFEGVVAKAISLRPNDRYRDCGELLEALRAAATGPSASPSRGAPTSAAQAGSKPGDGATTAVPASKTVRTTTGTTTPAKSRSRVTLLGAAAVVVLVGTAALVGVMKLRAQPSQKKKASSAQPSASTPAPSAPLPAPPITHAKASLADVAAPDLEARFHKVGFAIASRSGGDGPNRWIQFNYEKDGVKGELFWNRVNPPPTNFPQYLDVLTTLDSVRVWTTGDRERGLELVYAMKDEYVLSMSFPKGSPGVVSSFESVAADFDADVRGNSLTGPDPATIPADSRVAWRAKRVKDLCDIELVYRLGTLVASTKPAVKPGDWSFSVKSRSGVTGEVKYFDASEQGADALAAARFMADLRAHKQPFCYAADDVSAIVADGAGELSKRPFLEKLTEGTGANIACEP